jgi:hypothetical protein
MTDDVGENRIRGALREAIESNSLNRPGAAWRPARAGNRGSALNGRGSARDSCDSSHDDQKFGISTRRFESLKRV